MEITLFGVTSYRPLWEKQQVDDEHQVVKLLLGSFGYTISFWLFPVWFTSILSIAFLRSIQQDVSLLLSILGKFSPNFAIGLFWAVIMVGITVKFLLQAEFIEIKPYFKEFQTDIIESITLQYEEDERSYSSQKYFLILLTIVSLGFLAGLVEGILWFIPLYILYIFLVFFLANFISVSPSLFVVAMILSWIVIFAYKIRSKYIIHEPSLSDLEKQDITVSRRLLDIVASEDEPIICPSCRSFIASSSEYCPVCDEQLD